MHQILLTAKPELVEVTSPLNELEEEQTFTDAASIDDKGFSAATAKVSLVPNLAGQPGSAGAASIAERVEAQRTAIAVQKAFSQELTRPLTAGESKNFQLDSPIEGSIGASVSMGSGGDAGSVDRITMEIRRQLELSKVLVCWVLDSTPSMRERRETLIKRFDRVYQELNRLGVDRGKPYHRGC